jgi:hypothetical protein
MEELFDGRLEKWGIFEPNRALRKADHRLSDQQVASSAMKLLRRKSLKDRHAVIDPCDPHEPTGGRRYKTDTMEIDGGQVLPRIKRPSTWVWEFHCTRMPFCASWALIRKRHFAYQLRDFHQNAEPEQPRREQTQQRGRSGELSILPPA